MFAPFRPFARINIPLTQRQATLAVLIFYFLGTCLVAWDALLAADRAGSIYFFGGVSGAILFGGVWILYFKRNWEPARYFAAIMFTLLAGLLMPEPFVSQYAPMALVLPVILALILTESRWVILNAFLMISILLVRAGGSGVYAQPATLILYTMLVGGLLVRSLIAGTSLHQIKQAQEATQQSETRFRSLIENSSDEISILDASGTLLYESPSSNPTLGYPSVQFVGRNLFQLVHPEDVERVKNTLVELVGDPDLHPREQFRLLHRDGTWRWVEGVATNLLEEPSVHGIVLNYHDVTGRVQAEEQIQQQLKRLNGLRLIDIAIASSFDLNVTLDVVLRQVISLLEVDASAILLTNSQGQVLEYTASHGFRSDVQRLNRMKPGREYARQAILERKTIHFSTVAESDGETAQALQFADERFAEYYGAPLIAKGEIKGVLEIYHRSSLDNDPKRLEFLEALAGQAAIAIDNAQLFRSLQQANTELELRVDERTTELHRTNAELERANRTKDEFLANMSHELRTPLNSILGLSESLLEQRRGPLNDHQQRSLQVIEGSGQHLLELINDVLDLSKIEAGKFDFYPQPISVDTLCRSCLGFVKAQAAKKSVTVTYLNEPAVSQIYADPRRLKQILLNLLTNAVKFTSRNGIVILEVKADLEQDLIQFAVIDNGIGIAADDLPRLFQPFVQVDSSLNRLYEGTGLGLALVQKLTDLHGGSVHVESEVDHGSRFTIRLACNQAEIANIERLRSPHGPSVSEQLKNTRGPLETKRHGVILLAEDNLSNVLTIGEYLESHGYEVVVAHDGIEAIEKAERLNPDVILMDIQMPVMDGLEAIRHLRANPYFVSTPIIALTALAMPGDRERCLAAGASEYVSKPASLRALQQLIENLLPVHVAVY